MASTIQSPTRPPTVRSPEVPTPSGPSSSPERSRGRRHLTRVAGIVLAAGIAAGAFALTASVLDGGDDTSDGSVFTEHARLHTGESGALPTGGASDGGAGAWDGKYQYPTGGGFTP